MLHRFLRYLFVLTAIALSGHLPAQQVQTVSFAVAPGNAFVRINGQVLDLSKSVTIDLPPGTYEAEFWAPRLELVRQTVVVEPERDNLVRLGLQKTTAAYDAYRQERSRYNTQLLKRTLADVTVLGGTATMAYVTFGLNNNSLTAEENKLDNVEEQIRRARFEYENGISVQDIETAAAEYERLTARYDDLQSSRNTKIVGAGILTLAGVGISYLYLKKWRAKPVKPVYEEDNPFVSRPKPTLTPLIGYSPAGGQAGFSFTF